MRKLILLICIMAAMSLSLPSTATAGIIPSLEDPTGNIGFYPISNEISFYKNFDDSGANRGRTLQIISINSFKLLTTFTFEFTADYNFDYTPGLKKDQYVELSLVKAITPFVSVNIQRVIATFEPEAINQFGLRLVF